ncbi:putative glycosyltransferase family 1 protein [Diplodia seriata]|uniref:Putative glycosyltransferase family 1 protein n=1 Tax=Diplodia seriata TaxID=420778 RepID=A0A0G2EPL8_9PEZI|nr:putative glycosyltransferase family 1 protein [Diplodia seriata]
MKVPMDVMLGLQRGFHNTSKLYGEEPRQVEKVTGFSSGVKVAGKEFGIGLFEGISGLVTQPLKGAKEEGAGGFIKGFGKGIAGIALKPQAAAFAIPAYTMKGIYMGIRKPFGATIQNYIIAARTAQGWEEYNKSTAQERALIVELYQIIASSVKKKRNPGEKEMEAIQALYEPATLERAENSDLEEAIRLSLAEVSRGNPEEDALMERAMRNSIRETQAANPYMHEQCSVEEEARILHSVMEQSKLDVAEELNRDRGIRGGGGTDTDELEEALRRSRLDAGAKAVARAQQRVNTGSSWGSDSGLASPATVGEEDGVMGAQEEEDEELRKALEASERDMRGREDAEEKARREEEIVMEYVKKQSLAEEEHRKRMLGTGGGGSRA